MVVLLAGIGDHHRQQHGNGCCGQDNESQPPILHQKSHRNQGNLQQSLHQGIHNLVNGGPHGGHIVGHLLQNLSHRRAVHKFHRQALDFIGHANANGAGVMAADHVVHQIHVPIPHSCTQYVNPKQGQQSRQNLLDQIPQRVTGDLGLPICTDFIGDLAGELGTHHSAGDDDHTQQAAEGQPLPNGPGLHKELSVKLQPLAASQCVVGVGFVSPHAASPPVWES